MAEEALKKLREHVCCAICLDTYVIPRYLQCNHIFCEGCLAKLVVRDQDNNFSLPCPTCRRNTFIPASGVTGLQSAFQINSLLEIQNTLKMSSGVSGSWKNTPAEIDTVDVVSVSKYTCSVHKGRELELYCETCGELICSYCVFKGQHHNTHDYNFIRPSFERYKSEIMLSLEPMKALLSTVDQAVIALDVRSSEICSQEELIEASIQTAIGKLHDILDTRKTALVEQLHLIAQGKLKELALQKDQAEATQTQLGSCLEFVEGSLDTLPEQEALMSKKTISRQVNSLITMFEPVSLEPKMEADMVFSPSFEMSTSCEKYGKVLELGSTDPIVTGNGIEVASVEAVSVVNLKAAKQINRLHCEIISNITDTHVAASVEKTGHNHYQISYQPTIKGRHRLHIYADGEDIKGSPFSLSVKSPVKRLGTPLMSIDNISTPQNITVCPNGELLVSELGGCSFYTTKGKRLRFLGLFGSSDGQFEIPRGVAFDSDGNILVTDYGSHCIHKFTGDGKFVMAMGKSGGHLKFTNPTDLVYNPTNNKVYVLDLDHRVQVLNSDLTFDWAFSRYGNSDGRLYNPLGITCDGAGNIYIADSGNSRVQVFTAQGRFLRQFGRLSGLNCPGGISVDANGTVFVSDCFNDRVFVFTPDGQLVTSFGGSGSRLGEFGNPGGVALDESGVLYVCDKKNNRIQLF